MEKYLDILKKCRLFSNVKDDELLTMLGCLGARVESFSKNQTIISEGDKATHIGLLLSGSAQQIRIDYYGNRSIVENIQPSQLFAESFVCAEADHFPVDVIASAKSEVMFIDGRHILCTCCKSCSFHNQMIFNLMKAVASKNLQYDQKIEITSKRSTREKLMTYLMSQAKLCGSVDFTIPYDRQELADFLEVDRSGLSSVIGKLKREGIIDCYRSEFRLIDKGGM